MIRRCGALVLGVLVLSAVAAHAQVTFPVYNGGYVQPTGYTVGYGGYNAVGGYSNVNNVAIYQDQLRQTQAAYSGYYNGGYTNAYTTPYTTMGYGYTGFTGVPATYTSYTNYSYTNYNAVGVSPAYVGVNPWNGYAGNTYNGYTYTAPAAHRCPGAFRYGASRGWVNR